MKKIFFIFFALHFVLLITHSQPSITWNRLYEGGYNDNDYVYGFCRTSDGNYVIGGSTRYHGAAALKIDAYGNTVWLKHYSVTFGEAITATSDGGCLLVSPSFLKINSVGDSLWFRNYTSLGVTNLYDVIQCSDGGYFACGRAYYDSGYVMKTDIEGNLVWKHILSDTALIVRFYNVCEAYSNGYLVSGQEFSINRNYSVFARYDSNGQRIWLKTFDINNINSLGYGRRIVKVQPYYLIACTRGYMRMDDQGNVISSKLAALSYSESIFDMRILSDNRFEAVSQTYIMPILTSNLLIIDSSGNILNSRALNFSDYVRLKKVEIAGNGDFIYAGDAARYDTSYLDFYALRTDSSLNFPPIGINSISQNIPSEFQLYQNYPNPFNPSTKIKFSLPFPSQGGTRMVRLVVYDILGREVVNLIPPIGGGQEGLLPGIYEVTWDGTNNPSGVYFYRLSTDSYSETKKMVLLK